MSEQLTNPPQSGGTGGGDPPSNGGVEKARTVAHEVSDSGRHAAHEVAEDAKAQTRHVLDDARERARSQAEDQTSRASGFARELAGELRSMADGAESDGHLTSWAREGASRLERVSDGLDDGGLDRAVAEVRSFARRRPGLFLAGCFGAGVVLGRIVHNTDRSALRDAMSSDEEPDAGTPQGHELGRPESEFGTSMPKAPLATGPAATDLSAAGAQPGGRAS